MADRSDCPTLPAHLDLGVDLASLPPPHNKRFIERLHHPLSEDDQLLPRAPVLRRLLQLPGLLSPLEDPHPTTTTTTTTTTIGARVGEGYIDDVPVGDDTCDRAGGWR